jgi:hypothetical protein
MKKIISRYLKDKALDATHKDFRFLINKINETGHEYDLQIRDNYLNLYYKGNSIGKISYNQKKEEYTVAIHKKFLTKELKGRFRPVLKLHYAKFALSKRSLHPFFSSKNLLSMSQKVKKVGFQEEIIFEQMLISDNLGRKDLIIIDRQVMDRSDNTKMDLLALKRNKTDQYQFCVIEVKLGNNIELCDKVYFQLNRYRTRIENNFNDYKESYLKNVIQKQKLRLLPEDLKIKIVRGVLGLIVVGGYSGLGERSVAMLKAKHPDVEVLYLKNVIDFNQVR